MGVGGGGRTVVDPRRGDMGVHILVDMWEHAFYLDYLNVKADYVKAIWNIVNWQDVSERLATATAQAPGLIVR